MAPIVTFLAWIWNHQFKCVECYVTRLILMPAFIVHRMSSVHNNCASIHSDEQTLTTIPPFLALDPASQKKPPSTPQFLVPCLQVTYNLGGFSSLSCVSLLLCLIWWVSRVPLLYSNDWLLTIPRCSRDCICWLILCKHAPLFICLTCSLVN